MTMRVRTEECIGCEACVAYCPMDAISMNDGVAVIDQELCVECGLCIKAGNTPGLFRTPCVRACPAGVDVPRYVRLIASGKPMEALAVIREKIPFPAVCGLVCFHPCEAKCARARVDEPIAIRSLKRYAWDASGGVSDVPQTSPASGRRVAVVGSGPAGLTAAYYLARKSHAVAVYEATEQPGGMLASAIQEYKLPRDILAIEIAQIERMGVAIHTGSRIESIKRLFDEGYDAIFVAIGAQRSTTLGIQGENIANIATCMDFLQGVRRGQVTAAGNRTAVIGGGNSALEAARTARRLGASHVTVLYRRSHADMTASLEEYNAAISEGVKFEFQRAPVRLFRQDGHIALEHIYTLSGPLDDGGRPSPMPEPGSECVEVFDTVIACVGQGPEIPTQFGLATGDRGFLRVNPADLSTSQPGVYAGGDVVSGPASVIQAIAHGRRAAIAIDKYLGGDGQIVGDSERRIGSVELGEVEVGQSRVQPPCIPVEQRTRSFRQVELGLSNEDAVAEATRCLQCDLRERDCIAFENADWPRSLRNHFSEPGVAHLSTGIAGRGTEEMKTNDVAGRFKRGTVGLGIDVGRPSVGAYFRDVDIITRSLARLGVEFEQNNPVTKMIQDLRTGALREDILGEKVVSCVVEVMFPIGRLEEVLCGVKMATDNIGTVVSVCCINRASEDGSYELQKKLDELGIDYRFNGKQNAGLGRPRASV